MTTFGIDLGTTNSVIAQLVDGIPRAIPVAGSAIVPSTVLYLPDGQIVVGREARNLALLHPERVVRSVKRKMGRAGAIELEDREVTPEQVSAEILRTLAKVAATATGLPVRDVVITVPAYFDDAQRRATLAASELAGLHVLRLLNEPTAASLAYDQVDQVGPVGTEAAESSDLMLVYDLGGGTFDVSVLEVFGEIREVRATTGDTELGGDDFDAALVELFVADLREQGVTELDPAAMARLSRAAETAKIALSDGLDFEVSEEFLATRAGKPIHLHRQVTRREFEQAIADMLASTIDLTRRAVEDAKLQPGERIARICMVGGSTRIPMVRSLLAEAFDADIHEELDVDLAVGFGAAIQAGMLSGQPCARVLVDVTAHTLGIRVFGDDDEFSIEMPDSFAPVLRRNTALPAVRTEEFYTMIDGQESVRVEIFQGEAPRCSQNRLVGSFDFELTRAPAHTPVQFGIAYDLDGVVRVTASQAGGSERTVELTLPDASPTPREPAPTSPPGEAKPAAQGHNAVLRRAIRLLASLEGPNHARLATLVETWHLADAAERAAIEDQLLDLFLTLEAEE